MPTSAWATSDNCLSYTMRCLRPRAVLSCSRPLVPGTGSVLRKRLLKGWESEFAASASITILYLKIKRLDGLPILVVGELAKKHPLLLQLFIKPLKRVKDGGKILLRRRPWPPGEEHLPSGSSHWSPPTLVGQQGA